MPRPRVLFLAPYLTPEHAGAAQATITILQALSRAGWADVTVAAYEWDESVIPTNVRRIRLHEGSWPSPLWRLFPIPDYWTALRAVRTAELGAYDVCYTQNIALGLAYRRRCPAVPIVSHPGAILWEREVMEESEAPMRWRRLQAKFARWFEGRTYRQPLWHHFASSALVAKIRIASFGLSASTFQVAPLPVDPTRFSRSRVDRDVRQELGLSSSDFVVITVARLVAWKRIDAVIRAIARTRQRLILIVVGDGPDRHRLQSLAQRLELDDRVRFVGRQDPPPYLAAANLFALPSLIESFGLVYIEAMMMGLPCIGSRHDPPTVLSAASEVISDGDYGFCVDTEDELLARIEALAGDPQRCAAVGDRARAIALDRFTPDAYVRQLHELVERYLPTSRSQ